MVQITVNMLTKTRPVARPGRMVMDITADMTEMQMFNAIQSLRENVTGAVWARWMELFEEMGREDADFPYPTIPE